MTYVCCPHGYGQYMIVMASTLGQVCPLCKTRISVIHRSQLTRYGVSALLRADQLFGHYESSRNPTRLGSCYRGLSLILGGSGGAADHRILVLFTLLLVDRHSTSIFLDWKIHIVVVQPRLRLLVQRSR